MHPVVAVAFDLVRAEPAAIASAIGFMRDHALREQAPKRLGDPDPAKPLKCPRPEASVEQVQDRVLDTANILGDGKPRLRFGTIKRLVGRLAREADEVPS